MDHDHGDHDHGDHDHGDHGDHGDMDMDMPMYFKGGTHVTILFEFWETENVGAFVASLFVVFLLTFMYEALKFYRDGLYEKSSSPVTDRSAVGLLGGFKSNEKIFKKCHLIQTVLHMVQLVLSYFLMLIFMTYNVWLAVAVTLGAGAGYLLFRWNKSTSVDVVSMVL